MIRKPVNRPTSDRGIQLYDDHSSAQSHAWPLRKNYVGHKTLRQAPTGRLRKLGGATAAALPPQRITGTVMGMNVSHHEWSYSVYR